MKILNVLWVLKERNMKQAAFGFTNPTISSHSFFPATTFLRSYMSFYEYFYSLEILDLD